MTPSDGSSARVRDNGNLISYRVKLCSLGFTRNANDKGSSSLPFRPLFHVLITYALIGAPEIVRQLLKTNINGQIIEQEFSEAWSGCSKC